MALILSGMGLEVKFKLYSMGNFGGEHFPHGEGELAFDQVYNSRPLD
jgi:hypothetical protein